MLPSSVSPGASSRSRSTDTDQFQPDAFPNKRQSTQPKADSPAMTDKDGNIVAFDATGVYQANKANGL